MPEAVMGEEAARFIKQCAKVTAQVAELPMRFHDKNFSTYLAYQARADAKAILAAAEGVAAAAKSALSDLG